MKKYLLLLLAVSGFAQTNPTAFNRIRITQNIEDNLANRIIVQDPVTGELKWVLKSSLGGNVPKANANTSGSVKTTTAEVDPVVYTKTISDNLLNGKQNTLTNPITGSGTTNQLAKFTASGAVGNSGITDDGTNVGVGTILPPTIFSIRDIGRSINSKGSFSIESNETFTSIYMGVSNVDPFVPFMQSANRNNLAVQNLALNPNGGNVGINQSSPTEKLDVVGNGKFSGTVTAPTFAGALNGNANTASNGFERTFTITGSLPNLILTNTNIATETYNIAGSLNTDASGYGAFMLFQAPIGKEFYFNRNITSAGSITATSFFQSSDIRLKNIIKHDGDVIYFKWKDKRDTKTHIGYIAQKVRSTNPDQVNKDDKGMLSVNYIEILVEKIRNLEKEIELLKAK